MVEPLGVIDQADMVVPAGQQRIQEQGVYVLFKFPAVHLHAEFVTKDKGNRTGVVLHVLFMELFRHPYDLLQGDKMLIRDVQIHVAYDMYFLGDPFFPVKIINRKAIIPFIVRDYIMHNGKGLPPAEKGGITDQFSGRAFIPPLITHIFESIQHGIKGSGEGMADGNAETRHHI